MNLACRQNNLDAVKVLVLYGAEMNTSDNLGQTPLMAAIHNGNMLMADYLMKCPRNNAIATINAQDYAGTTALHLCAIYNNMAMAQILMMNGADPNKRNLNGQTPAAIMLSNGVIQLEDFPDVLAGVHAPAVENAESESSHEDRI